MSSGMNLSKEFFELLKSIGESKSKQEEDRIIQREIQTLKQKLETPVPIRTTGGAVESYLATNKKKAGEFLIRLLYVEMLGHDASFGYIKAVELAASSSITLKKTGYLLCSLCLPPEHEFRFMLVNQMQRDLASSSVLDVSAALLAVTNLITSDMVPAVTTEVSKLLDHLNDGVRKKAIIALHRFHQIAPEVVTKSDVVEKLRKGLCDRDPSVMAASLNCIESMARIDVKPFKDLVPSHVVILKQILENRLPSDYDYHRVPAPWIQMKIVRILSILGKGDATASNGMYEILNNCIKKADGSLNAGNAVIHECVRTITSIYPNSMLLDAAAEAISRFISSKAPNLRYLGITGLAEIVENHPQYAAAHQMSVIECLEDRDETIQRRTLDLLYKMTNSMNVLFITEKMLQFLRITTDTFLKRNLTGKVCSLAERYAPNNIWYIDTITHLFEISGDMVNPDVSQNLMTLIAEGAGEEDENADMFLRQHAVEFFCTLLDRPYAKLPRALIETIAWVLGEYAYLSEEFSLDEILVKLCLLVHRGRTLTSRTLKIVVSAIMKLVAQAGLCPPQAAKVIDDFTKSQDLDLQQRCLEFQTILISAPHILPVVLPTDASCEDIQVDSNLSFLDAYVRKAIAHGAKLYEKPDDDDDDYDVTIVERSKPSAFKMTPYAKPTAPTSLSLGVMKGLGNSMAAPAPGVSLPPTSGAIETFTPTATTVQPSSISSEPQLVLRNVASVWGKSAVSTNSPPIPFAPTHSVPVTPTPAPSLSSTTWSQSQPASTSFVQPTVTVEPVKTEEQLRKERMAAALFGGASAGSHVPPAMPYVPRRKSAGAYQSVSLVPSNPPTSAPPPSASVVTSTPAVASAPQVAATPDIDLLGFDLPVAPAHISSDSSAENRSATAVSLMSPEPSVAQSSKIVDPFSELFGDVGSPPSSVNSHKTPFMYLGSKLSPLVMTTAEFGQRWGAFPYTSPTTAKSSKVLSLDHFMSFCESVGAHKVETIAATDEGISAGIVSGFTLLIHGKITSLGDTSKLDVTIKSNDPNVGGVFAMHIQSLLR